MSIGPQGQKRPADSIGCAITMGMIATGEIEDTAKPRSGRVKSGHAEAKARTDSLTKIKTV